MAIPRPVEPSEDADFLPSLLAVSRAGARCVLLSKDLPDAELLGQEELIWGNKVELIPSPAVMCPMTYTLVGGTLCNPRGLPWLASLLCGLRAFFMARAFRDSWALGMGIVPAAGCSFIGAQSNKHRT